MPDTPSSTLWRAYLALAAGILAIGISPILVRVAQAPGPVSGFYRMAIGSLVLLLPFTLNARKQGIDKRGAWLAVLAGLFFGLDVTAWTTGIILSGATNPTLLANTAPLWVALGAVILFKEKLKWKFWASLALAMLGAAVILGLDIQQALDIGLGSFLGLLAGIFYGGFFLFAQPGRKLLDALSFLWISMTTSALVLLAFTRILGQPLTGYPTRTWLLFLAMGLIVQAAGWLIVTYAQGLLPASIVAPTMLGQPALTALIAWLLLGEAMTGLQTLGGLMVLGGIYLMHFNRNRA